MKPQYCMLLLFQSTIFFSAVIGIQWDHSVNFNDDYRLLWTISKPQQLQQHQQLHPNNYEVIFEVQVRTLGYLGFGFSRDGNRSGADIVIGWVDQGQTYFQVSKYFKIHMKNKNKNEDEYHNILVGGWFLYKRIGFIRIFILFPFQILCCLVLRFVVT